MSDAWVCPECGIDYATLHPPFAINTIRSLPRRYAEALEQASAGEDNEQVIRTRPAEGVWSAIEYAAHVADLMEPFTETVKRIYTEDNPDLSGVFWDPDEKAAADKYNQQPKADVLARLKSGAEQLANEAERVNAHGWKRMGSFGWGDRDLLTMLQNAAHEGIHHLRDIEKSLRKVRSA